MLQICLLCSAGMSTSLVVKKMQTAAQEKGIEANIWAAPASELSHQLDQSDVILLGPQVRYLLSQIKAETEQRGIPVDVIKPLDYGRLNGEGILDQAIRLLTDI